MTTRTLLPTLSLDGWVNTPIKAADYLLSHFFLSDYSQTAIFPGEVMSFSWLLQQYQDNLSGLKSRLQSDLSKCFSHYFSDVEVQVTDEAMMNSNNKRALVIMLVFTDENKVEYNLARVIEHDGMKVSQINAALIES